MAEKRETCRWYWDSYEDVWVCQIHSWISPNSWISPTQSCPDAAPTPTEER